ncbi:amidohydrolase family protein [Tuwongella immobilis]|uniref:amidohydrolase family protein n=1 Tax=Tuwongella immobilis TaxID=692036 RepID=UPI001E37E6CD|nr:amidohydrolase family protein [Tuwongella immobilis]
MPPPQSEELKRVESRVLEIGDRNAARLGLDRRGFFQTGAGMAAALLALNEVFGECYDVEAAEAADPKAFSERWPKDQFIFDVQTHHVDLSQKWYLGPDGKPTARFFQMLRPSLNVESSLEQLNRMHYVKELFGDSDTVMAIISGVPTREWDKNPLPPDQMVATRKYVNDLAGSRRVLSHGLLRPNLGLKELDELERQVKELKVDAWKMYTGAELGEKAWFLDDEKIAYPFWERTLKLGVKNVCVHKGLPLSAFNEKACTPFDVEKAAKDWPDLNFIIYHSAFRGSFWFGSGTGEKVPAPKNPDAQEIPWTSDLLRMLKKNPGIKNVYFELGSTFNMLSGSSPEKCLHMLGQMLQVVGPDRILWGTDSIWNGSPQSQIERFRRLKMTDVLKEKYGYPDLTPEVKAKIFGLNAARLFQVDVNAARKAIVSDQLTKAKEEYQRNPEPSQTQYGWIWVDESKTPSIPVGE